MSWRAGRLVRHLQPGVLAPDRKRRTNSDREKEKVKWSSGSSGMLQRVTCWVDSANTKVVEIFRWRRRHYTWLMSLIISHITPECDVFHISVSWLKSSAALKSSWCLPLRGPTTSQSLQVSFPQVHCCKSCVLKVAWQWGWKTLVWLFSLTFFCQIFILFFSQDFRACKNVLFNFHYCHNYKLHNFVTHLNQTTSLSKFP